MQPDAMLPEWTEEQPANLYSFGTAQSFNRLRLRRVESIVPYRRRGAVVASSSSTRFVRASNVSSAGAIDVTSVQSDSTVTAKRDYDSRSTTRERTVL